METQLTHYSTSALNNLLVKQFWHCVKSLDSILASQGFCVQVIHQQYEVWAWDWSHQCVWLYMRCHGTETSLQSCSRSSTSQSCSHDSDVGVWCDHLDDSGESMRLHAIPYN